MKSIPVECVTCDEKEHVPTMDREKELKMIIATNEQQKSTQSNPYLPDNSSL
jgi:hypothetical protein